MTALVIQVGRFYATYTARQLFRRKRMLREELSASGEENEARETVGIVSQSKVNHVDEEQNREMRPATLYYTPEQFARLFFVRGRSRKEGKTKVAFAADVFTVI